MILVCIVHFVQEIRRMPSANCEPMLATSSRIDKLFFNIKLSKRPILSSSVIIRTVIHWFDNTSSWTRSKLSFATWKVDLREYHLPRFLFLLLTRHPFVNGCWLHNILSIRFFWHITSISWYFLKRPRNHFQVVRGPERT